MSPYDKLNAEEKRLRQLQQRMAKDIAIANAMIKAAKEFNEGIRIFQLFGEPIYYSLN